MGNEILKVENLTKSYGKGTKTLALSSVSLSITEHEFVVILGSSGSGKSTLLNLIGGIDKPDSGSIFFSGEDITKYNDQKLTNYRKNEIGFIFQAFNLINDLTVEENIKLQASLLDSKASIPDLLSLVGLTGKEKSYPKELSGGEQQRVSIARALVKDSGILLLDEPTGALDYETGKKILKLVEELSFKGKTIIFVTHTKEIAKMADHVICMRSGKIVEEYRQNEKAKAEEIDW